MPTVYCAVACVYLSQIFVIFIVGNSVVTSYTSAENCYVVCNNNWLILWSSFPV